MKEVRIDYSDLMHANKTNEAFLRTLLEQKGFNLNKEITHYNDNANMQYIYKQS